MYWNRSWASCSTLLVVAVFLQTGDFVNHLGMVANQQMTFYGQEKVEYNAQLCLMNMAVHGLAGKIVSGDEANSFYHDAHNLVGKCDYVMANPPFNVDKVKSESVLAAGRLPLTAGRNAKTKEIGMPIIFGLVISMLI